MAAFRFILQGEGAYTNVDGQKMVMEEGDLILTPQWAWHEHAHEGKEPMVWIDGLDVPFIQSLQVISFQPYRQGRLPVSESIDPGSYYGTTRPVGGTDAPSMPFLHYRWRDTYPSLQRLGRGNGNPYDGVALEYINPATGGSTLPTLGCWIQMLRPGEHTKAHRHTSTSIYHAFRGSGTTMTATASCSHWEKGDTFHRAAWSWHEHANRSATEEASDFIFPCMIFRSSRPSAFTGRKRKKKAKRKSSQICLDPQGSSESRGSALGPCGKINIEAHPYGGRNSSTARLFDRFAVDLLHYTEIKNPLQRHICRELCLPFPFVD